MIIFPNYYNLLTFKDRNLGRNETGPLLNYNFLFIFRVYIFVLPLSLPQVPPGGCATIDRLRHGAYKVILEGKSYRCPRPLPESQKTDPKKRPKKTLAKGGEKR